MNQTLPLEDFLSQAINGVLIDVRTPLEYEQGHIPEAVNIPIFNNDERAEVGTIYTKQSPEAAIERGLEIVGPKMARFVKEVRTLAKNKPLFLYCWRGGMRSASMAWLMRTAGMSAVILTGGYKSYRQGFKELIEGKSWEFIIIAGMTGSGKTDVLHALSEEGEQVLDLEGLANHKGSVFGHLGQKNQPSTETFVNRIHQAMNSFSPDRPVWLECESATIGAVTIPDFFFLKMKEGRIVYYEIPREERLKRLVSEYGVFSTELLESAFLRIKKRLGLENTKKAISLLNEDNLKDAASIALAYYDKSYSKSLADFTQHTPVRFYHPEDNPSEIARKIKSLI